MILIAGLGNIGKEYENTRHNVGFMLVDLILKDGGFSDVSSAKFQGELYKKGSLLLLKPSTYMNASGKSLKAVNDFYKPERIIVVHDELDIAFGAMRFKHGGSSGGHNGIKSIDALIGNSYDRVRIGIGRSDKGERNVISYVLGEFDNSEMTQLNKILLHAKEAVLALANSGDIAAISSKFTLKA
ncbi:MAG: aminoacyl-tRNA hydrolase [Campylobacter sp.]|jgi:PTH1 family peptidyl-tRNA hydrolase|uniref:aminoacyl-tRNA hydrolase n=1 Tax=Campylobacter sp. TaxID=205 RepID=UPI001B01E9A2|nr:aminoacyl-tRNA hydrolase [Campylobacter sp.]MBO7155018.1 aminoacyl-tRNA hydrolase [Campylobacter sp.]